MTIADQMLRDLHRTRTVPIEMMIPERSNGELQLLHTWEERATAYYLGHNQLNEFIHFSNTHPLTFCDVPVVSVRLDDHYAVIYA